MGSRHVLSRWEVRAVYDRVGAWQDTQAVYEIPAFDKLVEHGRFEDARAVFEVGCGTGRFAERLLRDHCPLETRYEGVDLSSTMVRTARERLTSFGERATVRRTDGALTFDRPDESQDRIVITYVLDLLSRDDARMLLNEAHRLLGAQGRLCLAGLTGGAVFCPGGSAVPGTCCTGCDRSGWVAVGRFGCGRCCGMRSGTKSITAW